ncbi:MAG TPA: bifunctional DNA-formamidopyrimidine glycosylase/DNA-(apurinic or apyrimidinic site) lyase [Kiloniellaceae bacterium]|nr:bifunctional DNA-formamidopyrimidine glycosylase/DNA-(apurinic or apyrimidinic site) lyase [Kiloniellaceae bacterium]
MPELPEVETTRRGIEPHIRGHCVSGVSVRQPRLRWPVPPELDSLLTGRRLHGVERRAKYLLLRFGHGTLILHLGMSGSLRILPAGTPPQPHDHVDLVFGRHLLRLRDPRRFGAVLWTAADPFDHPLLASLGPEPLEDAFDGPWLYQRAKGRRAAVKQLVMDAKVVVGVGNIYASEALFAAGIHPRRPAGRISLARYDRLSEEIKKILTDAIRQGGTTLRDFQQQDGRPGYFAQQLKVYGRTGEPCPRCQTAIRQVTMGQRSSYYCPQCQR